jgi:hypothetical protein
MRNELKLSAADAEIYPDESKSPNNNDEFFRARALLKLRQRLPTERYGNN